MILKNEKKDGNFLCTAGSTSYLGMLLYAVCSLGSMATMSMGAGVLAICIIFDKGQPSSFLNDLSKLQNSVWIRRYGIASILLIFSCVLSLVSACWYPLQFNDQAPPVDWMRDLAKIVYFFLPPVWVIGWLRLTEDQKKTIFRVWFLTFGILSLVGVLQFFTGFPRKSPNPLMPGYYMVFLLLGHHLSVASIWIFPFFALLDSSSQKTLRKKLGLPPTLLLVFLAAGFFSLVFTYSRTLWLALPIGLGVWMIGRMPRKTAISTLVLTLALGLLIFQTPIFKQRLHSHGGIQPRVELWKANLLFFQNRPIFGVGLGKNQELSHYYFQQIHPNLTDFFIGHAHNIYLEMLAGLGVVGTLAWIVWIFRIFQALLYTVKLGPSVELETQQTFFFFPLGVISAFIILLLNGLTQVNFWEGKVLHQIMWITGIILDWTVILEEKTHEASH